MADEDLDAIRARRLAELQGQYGVILWFEVCVKTDILTHFRMALDSRNNMTRILMITIVTSFRD